MVRCRKKVISLLVVLCLLVGPVGAPAGMQAVMDRDQDEAVEPTTLRVSPADTPRPALRYRMRIPADEQVPGNAAVLYYQAMVVLGQQPQWRGSDQIEGEWSDSERLYEWSNMAIDELPADQVREVLERYERVLERVDRAASHAKCDWQRRAELGEKGFMLQLPELGQMRTLARLVVLRTRLAILERRYDDALDSLRTGYTLARHTNESPILIGHLVAVSIFAFNTQTALEIIAAPDSPNLYWALAMVERHGLDIRPAAETDMRMLYITIPDLKELSVEPMSRDQADALWERTFRRIRQRLAMEGPRPPGLPTPAFDLMVGLVSYTEARERLIEQGHDPDDVEAMPVKQAILLHWVDVYDYWTNELRKWVYLPHPEAVVGLSRVQRDVRDSVMAMSFGPGLFLRHMPAVSAAMRTSFHAPRWLAQLRCLEAIRLHVHETGTLPETLDEITAVPVPRDPVSGDSFIYQRDGDGFALEPDGEHLRVRDRERLRVRLRTTNGE